MKKMILFIYLANLEGRREANLIYRKVALVNLEQV